MTSLGICSPVVVSVVWVVGVVVVPVVVVAVVSVTVVSLVVLGAVNTKHRLINHKEMHPMHSGRIKVSQIALNKMP